MSSRGPQLQVDGERKPGSGAIPLAWIVERTNTPLRAFVYIAALVSFAIPGIVKAIAWIMLLGPNAGLINVWLREIFGFDSGPFNIFSMYGMVFVEGILWAPLVFLLMVPAFRSMDPNLEDASAMSGAGMWSTAYRITLKLALPSILSVLLLAFVRSMEAFEIPALIGIPGGVDVLTTRIWLAVKRPVAPNWRQEILNYFDFRIISGFVKGKNNRIKTIKKINYGYRNMVNFRLRILATNYEGGRLVSHLLT